MATNVVVALRSLIVVPLLMIGQEKQATEKKVVTAPSSQGENSESEPQTAEEAYRRGTRLVQTRRLNEAISMFDRAILLKPDWAQAFAARGRALSQAKRYADAIKDFDAAIRLESDKAGWYNSRGLAYSNSGQHSRAIEDYVRAIELNPNSSVFYNNRGWAYSDLGQFEKAIADLTRAIQLAPDYVKAYENRATAYTRIKDWPHAIADYTAAIQLGPTGWQYLRRAEAKLAAGDQAGAEEDRSKGATQEAATSTMPSSSAYRIGNGVTPPAVSSKVEPHYSEEARHAGLEGTVVLFVVVDSDGKPRDLRVIRSLGLGLDESAIEAVSQWQFVPGTKGGQAVPVQATIQVNFRLLDQRDTNWRLVSISFRSPQGASRPHLLSAKHPRASDPGESGSITLTFDVDEHGVPGNFHVENSTDQEWERKILEALQNWRFSPGSKDGEAVTVPCSLSFSLGGNVAQ